MGLIGVLDWLAKPAPSNLKLGVLTRRSIVVQLICLMDAFAGAAA